MTDAADTQSARIRQLEDERYQAMLSGDVETLDRLLSSRLNYTHSWTLIAYQPTPLHRS